MRQLQGLVRYGGAYATPVPPPDDEEGTPALAAADDAGGARRGDHGPGAPGRWQPGRAGGAALEEYLTLARAHEGETWFDVGAWSEDLAGSYLALGRVDDAVRTISDATRGGYAEGAGDWPGAAFCSLWRD
jgi:hypothetical protein